MKAQDPTRPRLATGRLVHPHRAARAWVQAALAALATLAALAALAGSTALAQPAPGTIAEVLERGGRQLTGEEAKALAAGATIGGGGGQSFELRLDADGRLQGWVGLSRIPASGRWNVNDAGQLCWDVAPRLGGMRYATCAFWYRLDGQHFASETGARDSTALPRQVAR